MKANLKLSLLLSLFLAAQPHLNAQTPASVPAEYYGETGCSHCDDFAVKALPAAENATGVKVLLTQIDILSSEGYERCRSRLREMGCEFTIFPVLVIGNNVYQGNMAVEANLVSELQWYSRNGTCRPRIESPASKGQGLTLAVLPIFLAGLVDGINPCAFATLLFFVSFISLKGGSRRRIAAAGLLFAAGVFLSYLLIGLGLFSALREGFRIAWLRFVLRVLVTGFTAVFCVLTLRDILILRSGGPRDGILQLPAAVKLRIHSAIRGGARSALFALGVFVSGVLVAVLELACTGQVYFPAISYMVRTDRSWLGLGSLLLYNLAFIAPLLTVLVLILSGVRQASLRSFFERNIVLTKVALALIFAVLTVLVWIF